MLPNLFGYLLVHFVEDRDGHGEQIHFSLSQGDDPLRWSRLNDGGPVLSSDLGTTGARDPHLVRRPGGGYHIVATDLRVWRNSGPDWEEFRRHGSRSILVWDSADLVTWSEPRLVEIAPKSAGMAWAPESVYDARTGEFLVHFAAALYAQDDPGHAGPCTPEILVARTRDFREFSAAEAYLRMPGGVIDMTVAVADQKVHRFAKQDDAAPRTLQVFHQIGSEFLAGDFQTLSRNIGGDLEVAVEGPLVFPSNGGERWYLWVDQFAETTQGYRALTTTDLRSGEWESVDAEDFHLPANTKHGSVLPLTRAEYDAIEAAA